MGNTAMIWIVLLVIIVAIGFLGYRAVLGVKKITVSASKQEDKISKYSNPEAFITVKQLKELMDTKANVVVIGTLNPVKLDKPIKDSFSMWRPDYSASKEIYDFDGMRNKKGEMEGILSKFGVDKDTTIVIYAANSHHDSARLWWQIKMIGHEDVRFLDGGLNLWVGAGYPVGTLKSAIIKTKYTAANISNARVADLDLVKKAVGSDEWVIIDTRSKEEHKGTNRNSGIGAGRIPGSVLIDWSSNFGEDGTLLSKEELELVYLGTIEGKKVITYCQTGVRAASTYLVINKILGKENVYLYDGSWAEWSYQHYVHSKVDIEKG